MFKMFAATFAAAEPSMHPLLALGLVLAFIGVGVKIWMYVKDPDGEAARTQAAHERAKERARMFGNAAQGAGGFIQWWVNRNKK